MCARPRERTLVAAAPAGRGVPTVVFDPTAFPGAGCLTFDPGEADECEYSAVWSVLTDEQESLLA